MPPGANPQSALTCLECETAVSTLVATNAGTQVCQICLESFYVACHSCGGIVPLDEVVSRRAEKICVACRDQRVGATQAVESADVESVVAEYVALHADEKRLKTRMDELKETLKTIAAQQERVSNGVTLNAGDQAVKCNYRTTIKYDAEAVEKLAQMLDREKFDELFEREVTYSPHKERVREFLDGTDGARQTERELLRAAVRETESATLTVVPNRRK